LRENSFPIKIGEYSQNLSTHIVPLPLLLNHNSGQ